MPDPGKAVFLSYAREDTEAAKRLADALRGFGVEVWFDQNELRGGDTWDQKIRGQIRTCALFMAVISANTQQRTEGYFRREWKIAVERTHDMADGVPFIVPVVIDATAESAALVPEQFMRVQWTRLEGGMPTPEFITQTRHLLDPNRRVAGSVADRSTDSRAVPSPAAAPAPGKSPLLAVGAVAVLAIAAAIFFALRPAAKEPAPAATVKLPAASPTAPSPAPVPPKVVADKSIAVLPLANMSEDKDTGFFADGVHEDLLTNLALVSELKVVSRTTAMQYRGSTKSMKQIGEELGVAYILEGSVRRSGNKVRVTGQLINARTDEHVWAKSYDRDLTDIFTIQASLSQEIASALQAAITPQAQKFIERRPTENPVAYDAFLKGRDVRNKSRSGLPAPLKRAEEFFQTAVDQDPKFAAAWGELAAVHALHAFWEIDHSPARMARAEAAMARAVELAPDAPDVIGQVGTFAYYAHRDYAKATEQYQKLAKLKPNDPTVYASLGLIQRRQGKWNESLANLRRAVELDPGNAGYSRNLIQSLENGRRWPELLAEQRRFIGLVDDKLTEEAVLTRYQFWATGSTAEGAAFFAALPPEQQDSPKVISIRKGRARGTGQYEEFLRLDRLQPYYDEDGTPRYQQATGAAIVYAAMGDDAGARQRLGDYPAELRAHLAAEPGNYRIMGELALMEALLGHRDEALRLARRGVELLPESRDALDGVNFSLWYLVCVQAWVGEKDAAFAGLTHILRVPSASGGVHAFRFVPWLVRLRDDPRWEKLLTDPVHLVPLF